jgi:hypothetical protein
MKVLHIMGVNKIYLKRLLENAQCCHFHNPAGITSLIEEKEKSKLQK